MRFSFANYVHFAMTSNEFLFAGLFIQVLDVRGVFSTWPIVRILLLNFLKLFSDGIDGS